MQKGDVIVVENVSSLITDLANAGSNIRVFLSERNELGTTIPDLKYRLIRAVAAKYSDPLRPSFVFITPKYDNHVINYLIHGDRKKENSPGIQYFFADRSHASVQLSNGFTYTIYYRSGNLPRHEKGIMGAKGADFNISGFFGTNY